MQEYIRCGYVRTYVRTYVPTRCHFLPSGGGVWERLLRERMYIRAYMYVRILTRYSALSYSCSRLSRIRETGWVRNEFYNVLETLYFLFGRTSAMAEGARLSLVPLPTVEGRTEHPRSSHALALRKPTPDDPETGIDFTESQVNS